MVLFYTPKASISWYKCTLTAGVRHNVFWSIVLLFGFLSVREKQLRNRSNRTRISTPWLPVGVVLTVATRNDVIFLSVDIDTRVKSLVMFFSFTKNNGTDRDTPNIEWLFSMTEVLYSETSACRIAFRSLIWLPSLCCRTFRFFGSVLL